MAGHGHKLSVVPACGQVLAAANNNTTNWIWFYNNGWSHTPATPRCGPRSMAQYLLNIFSIKVYFPNWTTLGSDVTHVESRVYYDTRIVATNKENICLFSPRCVSPRLDTFLLPGPGLLAVESEL